MNKNSKYIYSILPFSDFTVVAIVIFGSIFLFFAIRVIFSNNDIVEGFLLSALVGLVIFIVYPAQVIFLNIKSPFQKKRKLIKASVDYRSFMRVLVYSDGVEFKRHFRSYFIPYEYLLPVNEPSEEDVFFSLKLESTLPEMPPLYSRPGIYPYIMDTINEQRGKYLSEHASKPEKG